MSGIITQSFILEPVGVTAHADASREALLKYAEIIKLTNYRLAKDIEIWVTEETYSAAASCVFSNEEIIQEINILPEPIVEKVSTFHRILEKFKTIIKFKK